MTLLDRADCANVEQENQVIVPSLQTQCARALLNTPGLTFELSEMTEYLRRSLYVDMQTYADARYKLFSHHGISQLYYQYHLVHNMVTNAEILLSKTVSQLRKVPIKGIVSSMLVLYRYRHAEIHVDTILKVRKLTNRNTARNLALQIRVITCGKNQLDDLLFFPDGLGYYCENGWEWEKWTSVDRLKAEELLKLRGRDYDLLLETLRYDLRELRREFFSVT